MSININTKDKLKEKFSHAQSPQEQAAFEEWLVHQEYADEKMEALREIWDSIDEANDPASIANSLGSVKASISKEQKRRIRMRWYRYSAVVAVALLLLTVTVGMRWMFSPTVVPTVVVAMAGEQKHIKLPDGSEVWINSGSQLSYGNDFNTISRTIKLQGEAYFKVKGDARRPFIVRTPHLDVTALGTEFNVTAYPGEHKTTASLYSGKIKVDVLASKKNFLLNGEQELVYDESSKEVTCFESLDNANEWKDDQLIFRNASIHDILKSLERHYNVTISTNFNNTDRYYIKFVHQETLEQALVSLSMMVEGFHCEWTKNS